MDALLISERLDTLWEQYQQGELSYNEYKRFVQATREDCPHDHVTTDINDYDYYTECVDCGEEL